MCEDPCSILWIVSQYQHFCVSGFLSIFLCFCLYFCVSVMSPWFGLWLVKRLRACYHSQRTCAVVPKEGKSSPVLLKWHYTVILQQEQGCPLSKLHSLGTVPTTFHFILLYLLFLITLFSCSKGKALHGPIPQLGLNHVCVILSQRLDTS